MHALESRRGEEKKNARKTLNGSERKERKKRVKEIGEQKGRGETKKPGKREMEREGDSRPRVYKLWKTRRTRGLANDAIMATVHIQSQATNFFLPIRH